MSTPCYSQTQVGAVSDRTRSQFSSAIGPDAKIGVAQERVSPPPNENCIPEDSHSRGLIGPSCTVKLILPQKLSVSSLVPSDNPIAIVRGVIRMPYYKNTVPSGSDTAGNVSNQ